MFLVTFSLTSEESFKSIEIFLDQIQSVKEESDIPTLIVGTKSDLVNERTVQKEKIENFCKEKKLKCLESSSKQNHNVDTVFTQILVPIIEKKYLEKIEDEKEEKMKKKRKKRKENCFLF